MRGVLFASALSIVACQPPTPLAPVRIEIKEETTRFVLPNGLEVIVQEDHRTPNVAVNLRYHSGSKNDPPGRAGMAHLVEHLQFTESQRTQRDSFFRTMAALGAREINGMTMSDATEYYETVPASQIEPVLWMEADRMESARLGWSQTAIDREKSVVGQELRLRFQNEPNGFRHQLLSRAVYPEHHPYRRALDEEAEERASTPDELRDFASRAYGPDNATLMLVGDVTGDRAKELVTRYFATVPPRTATFAPMTIAPVERAAAKRVNVVADVEDPVVYIAWPLPAPGDDGYYEAHYAIGTLEGYASYNADHEHKSVRPGSVSWGIVPARLGSIGYIYGTPAPGSSPDDLVDSIEVSRKRIVARDLGTLAAHRSFYIATEVRAAEGLGERAQRMQEYLELYGDAAYVMKDLKALQAVTRDRMVAAVDQMLDLDRAVVVVVTPDHSAPRAGRVVSTV
ncbi:MAG TPA: pitrilysin family protein, partial [Polyangiaceae bacterium]